MATAGYSGTPLPKKLGIKEGHRVLLLSPPSDFGKTLGELPALVSVETHANGEKKPLLDVVVAFVKTRPELARALAARTRLDPAGGLWIAWPKKASGVATDVTEDVVRVQGLATGLVDNKVCAIDETWSGLRLVYRVADRPKKRPAKKR
jgi:hypothetical protein